MRPGDVRRRVLPSAALAKSGTTLGRIAPVLVVIRVALALSHVLLARDSIAVAVESAHGRPAISSRP
ncbi:hypothetical protein SVXHr_2450 [Halorhabdus sp. SVX81]|nr:hypothetical protein SVXHr_2450 [Halorhabdus sp. SVX81]